MWHKGSSSVHAPWQRRRPAGSETAARPHDDLVDAAFSTNFCLFININWYTYNRNMDIWIYATWHKGSSSVDPVTDPGSEAAVLLIIIDIPIIKIWILGSTPWWQKGSSSVEAARRARRGRGCRGAFRRQEPPHGTKDRLSSDSYYKKMNQSIRTSWYAR